MRGSQLGTQVGLFGFGLVERRAVGQVLVFGESFGIQRLRNCFFFVKPLAQIDKFAAFGAERAKGTAEPLASFATLRADHHHLFNLEEKGVDLKILPKGPGRERFPMERTFAKNGAVGERGVRATCSGVPAAMI
jgi:hypothetical protein